MNALKTINNVEVPKNAYVFLTDRLKQKYRTEVSFEKQVIAETIANIQKNGLDIKIRRRLSKCPERIHELSETLEMEALVCAALNAKIVLKNIEDRRSQKTIINSLDSIANGLKGALSLLK